MKLWKTALALALAGVLALALTGCSMLYARPNDVDLFDKDGMEAGDLWDRPVWEENDPLPSQDGGEEEEPAETASGDSSAAWDDGDREEEPAETARPSGGSGSGSSGHSAQQDWGTVYSDTLQVVIASGISAPYVIRDSSRGVVGDYSGITIEVAAELARRMGLELELREIFIGDILPLMQTGMYDMTLGSLSYTPERDTFLDFTQPYAENVQVVLVHSGGGISLDGLEAGGLTVGVQEDTLGRSALSGLDVTIESYDLASQAVEALLAGEVDAVVLDQAPARTLADMNSGVTILPDPLVEEEFSAAVAEGNNRLREGIETVLAEMRADGTLNEIVERYINAR